MVRASKRVPPLLLLLQLLVQLPSCAALAAGLPSASLDVLLQVRLANLRPRSLQSWILQRPFAAVLPMQPMLVLPLEPPEHGATLTFRRKPNSEKGGQDGGLRFSIASEQPTGDDDDEMVVLTSAPATEECVPRGTLLVSRISEGQYTNKPFSERAITRCIKQDLLHLPPDVAQVTAVVDFLEDQQQRRRET